MKLRISVVQFQIEHLQRERNFARIDEWTAQAVREGANVVVFPEDCITGSIFGDHGQLDRDGANRARFQELARTHHVDVVTGSSMELADDGRAYNTSAYIDAEGCVRCVYRKNHLYPTEYSFLSPGHEAPVFDTAYGRAAIVICWDLLFPEHFQKLVAQGVEIIYCPSYWFREIAGEEAEWHPECEAENVDALCRVRALEAKAVIVYANAAGIMTYPNGCVDTLIGHSQIVMPMRGVVGMLPHHDEEMLTRTVDLEILATARHIYRDEP